MSKAEKTKARKSKPVWSRDDLARDMSARAPKKSPLSIVDAKQMIDDVLAAVSTALADGHDVSLRGFGRWRQKYNASHRGTNPKTGEPIQTKPNVAVKFAPSNDLRETLNTPDRVQRAAKAAAEPVAA